MDLENAKTPVGSITIYPIPFRSYITGVLSNTVLPKINSQIFLRLFKILPCFIYLFTLLFLSSFLSLENLIASNQKNKINAMIFIVQGHKEGLNYSPRVEVRLANITRLKEPFGRFCKYKYTYVCCVQGPKKLRSRFTFSLRHFWSTLLAKEN